MNHDVQWIVDALQAETFVTDIGLTFCKIDGPVGRVPGFEQAAVAGTRKLSLPVLESFIEEVKYDMLMLVKHNARIAPAPPVTKYGIGILSYSDSMARYAKVTA